MNHCLQNKHKCNTELEDTLQNLKLATN